MKSFFLPLVMLLGQVAFARIALPADTADYASQLRGRRGLELYFIQNHVFSGTGSIHARLRETDYPVPGNFQVFWGGGVQYRLDRVLVGLELAHTINPYGPRTSETASTRRNAYSVQLHAYYPFYLNNDIRVYPFLGAGGMETMLTLTRNTPEVDFNQVLAQPGNAVSLNHFQSFVNIGVGFDGIVEKVGSGMLVNMRFGYRAGDLSKWYSDHMPLRNAPSDRLSNFYLQINLGYGWNWLSARQRAMAGR